MDCPEWNLEAAFFSGARANWSSGIQAVESSICARGFQQRGTGHQFPVMNCKSRITILPRTRYNPRVREHLEYAALWLLLKTIGAMPRPVARFVGARTAAVLLWMRPGLRAAASENLKLAFPEWSRKQRRAAIRGMVRQLGWMGAEFAHFPRYTKSNIERIVLLDGFENFATAQARGKGVLFLTGHMSAWELAPFAQALFGYPLHFLARAIDNPRVDALVTQYRCLSGNLPIEKNQSARAVLKVLAADGTVGILADHNTLLAEGVFVDFFGIPACTTAGLARFALHTDAAVVPGFLHWDARFGSTGYALSRRLNWCAPATTPRTFARIHSDSRA